MDAKMSFSNLHQSLDLYVESLSHSERVNLETGKTVLKFMLVPLTVAPAQKKSGITMRLDAAKMIVNQLKQYDSREDGYNYLVSLHLNRNGYQLLLRLMDLPYTSRDNTRMMQTKLVEGAIGYRLRSQAILQA